PPITTMSNSSLAIRRVAALRPSGLSRSSGPDRGVIGGAADSFFVALGICRFREYPGKAGTQRNKEWTWPRMRRPRSARQRVTAAEEQRDGGAGRRAPGAR